MASPRTRHVDEFEKVAANNSCSGNKAEVIFLQSHNEHKQYAELAFPLALDKTLLYAVPEALRDRVAVGMRALCTNSVTS